MKVFLLSLLFPILAVSCRMHTNPHQQNKTLRLGLHPAPESRYSYDIKRESSLKSEVEARKITKLHTSDVVLTADISGDSTGNFIVKLRYNNIHLYTKADGKETVMDTKNKPNPFSPEEQILHALKDISIKVVIDSGGRLKSVDGYRAVVGLIMINIPAADFNTRMAVRKQINQLIGRRLIKGNVAYLFKAFPGRKLHVGDTWKDTTMQTNDLNLKEISVYRLAWVSGSTALIERKSNIGGNGVTINLMGTELKADIHGKQTGEYKINTETGMIIKSHASTQLDGTIYVMGRHIPVTIENKISVTRKQNS